MKCQISPKFRDRVQNDPHDLSLKLTADNTTQPEGRLNLTRSAVPGDTRIYRWRISQGDTRAEKIWGSLNRSMNDTVETLYASWFFEVVSAIDLPVDGAAQLGTTLVHGTCCWYCCNFRGSRARQPEPAARIFDRTIGRTIEEFASCHFCASFLFSIITKWVATQLSAIETFFRNIPFN